MFRLFFVSFLLDSVCSGVADELAAADEVEVVSIFMDVSKIIVNIEDCKYKKMNDPVRKSRQK